MKALSVVFLAVGVTGLLMLATAGYGNPPSYMFTLSGMYIFGTVLGMVFWSA
jgi:hypothetical protein